MQVAELTALGQISVRAGVKPEIGPGEVLLRTLAVGLCGTDLKAYRRGHPYFKPPCVLGHELVGRVTALGDGVLEVACGDRVACAPYAECGVCAMCRKGLAELCRSKSFISGALQEYVRVPRDIASRGLVRLEPHVDDITATLVEPVACALNGVERAGVTSQSTVLVVGGGPMGALLGLISRSRGAQVLVSEICEERGQKIENLGLLVVNPLRTSLSEEMRRTFDDEGADRVLVAVGDREVSEQAMAYANPGGTALLFGGLPSEERLSVDPFAIHYLELTLTGSFGFQLRHFHEAGRWIADHVAEARKLITGVVPFESIGEAFAEAEQTSGMKTVVSFLEDR